MTTSLTYANLPAHKHINLSAQERESLPVVDWLGYTAPQYKHLRSTNTLGVWTIGHPRETSSGVPDPVDISYQMPMEDGETMRSIMDSRKENSFESLEGWKQWAKISAQEIGYAINQDYAALFVEKALRQPPGLDPEKILLDAGFEFQHEMASSFEGGPPTRVFRKPASKNRFFSVMVSPYALWMTHEKSGSGSWDNLLRASTLTEGGSGDIIPRFISPHVASIVAAAAEMAVYIEQNWTPEPALRRRRKP